MAYVPAPAKWVVRKVDRAEAERLAEAVGCSTLTAMVLINRGIKDAQEAIQFLRGGKRDLHSGLLLKGVKEAIAVLDRVLAKVGGVPNTQVIPSPKSAAANSRRGGRSHKQPVMVILGDYDVDGMTGTTILEAGLRMLGIPCEYYIPLRVEGYGVSETMIRELAARDEVIGIITVDTGSTAFQSLALARQLRPDWSIILTDHHQMEGEETPPCDAFINPHQSGCPYPNKDLCGAAVAWKLFDAYFEQKGLDRSLWEQYLDLVSLALVADVVPLTGENHTLVRVGLAETNRDRNAALLALKENSSRKNGERVPTELIRARSYTFGYDWGPILNALGRLEDAAEGVELLRLRTMDLLDEARERVATMAPKNRERREMQKEQAEWASEIVGKRYEAGDLTETSVPVVLADRPDRIHPGVMGLVASDMVKAYYRPFGIAAIYPDQGIYKASWRSIEGFNIVEGLFELKDQGVLLACGGHAAAAGMTGKIGTEAQVESHLSRKLAEAAAKDPDILIRKIYIDALLAPTDLSTASIMELEALEPTGHGNEPALFGVMGAQIRAIKPMGAEQQHFSASMVLPPTITEAVTFTIKAGAPEPKPVKKGGLISITAPESGGAIPPGGYIHGAALPGEEVVVLIDGEPYAETTADQNGKWKVRVVGIGRRGKHTVVAHLRKRNVPCVGFNLSEKLGEILKDNPEATVDLIGVLEINRWRGSETPRFRIRDLRRSEIPVPKEDPDPIRRRIAELEEEVRPARAQVGALGMITPGRSAQDAAVDPRLPARLRGQTAPRIRGMELIEE